MKAYPIGIEEDDETTNVGGELTITPEVEALARRPYPLVIWHDDENGWAGIMPDLPGLSAAGDTPEEMIAIAEEAKRLWIAAALADGKPVPDPTPLPAATAQRGIEGSVWHGK
jgi:predicted RNase H-like HicB family nuclease